MQPSSRPARQLCARARALPGFDEALEGIRRHLCSVARALGARAPAFRTEETRAARARNLAHLTAYARRGVLPRNHDAPERVPCFVDAGDRPCAVAHLLREGGEHDLTARLARSSKNHLLLAMNDPSLEAWVAESGLDAEELAWIQPTYPIDPCDSWCQACADVGSPLYDWDGHTFSPVPGEATVHRPTLRVVDGQLAQWPEEGYRLTPRGWAYWPLDSRTRGWASSLNETWLVDTHVRKRVHGEPELSATLPELARGYWTDAWGTGETTWFVGRTGALRRQGDDAYFVTPPPGAEPGWESGSRAVDAVAGSGAGDVWLLASGRVVHWDGARFEKVSLASQVSRVSAVPGAAWFAGQDLIERKGNTCRHFSVSGGYFTDVVAGAPSHVVVAARSTPALMRSGTSGSFHWDGAQWHRIEIGYDGAVQAAGGKVRLFSSTGVCFRFGPSDTCLADRARACAARGRTPHPVSEPQLPLPRLTATRACPLAPVEVAAVKLPPLAPTVAPEDGGAASDAGAPSDAGAEPDAGDAVGAERPAWGGGAMWALGSGLLFGVGVGAGFALGRRARSRTV